MKEFAGPQWCARFPTSRSTSDLTPDFCAKVERFNSALIKGGASVTINATYRPPERAYLMHWCCMIAKGGQDPAAVPPIPTVPIDWTCGGDRKLVRLMAWRMVQAYDIAFPAALVSRHTQRRAVDMTVASYIGKVFAEANGKEVVLSHPDDLWALGATYGVIKLQSDPPHWSDDGH